MRSTNGLLTQLLGSAVLLAGCGGDSPAPIDANFDTVIDSAPDATTSVAAATFVFHATSAPSTFRCSVDGATSTACTSPFTTTVTDGPHTFAVTGIDAAQTVDQSPAMHGWTLDQVGPQTTITSGPPADDSQLVATFEFTADDAAATFECALDDAVFAACSSPINVVVVADGDHKMAVRAIDTLGNRDASPAEAAWRVDTTVPETLLVTLPRDPAGTENQVFTFDASAPGGEFTCSLDGSDFEVCVSPLELGTLTTGAHTFEVVYANAAGTKDPTPATFAWHVDVTAPVLVLNVPADVVGTNSVTFGIDVTDDTGVTTTCIVDSATPVTCLGTFTTDVLPDGVHTLSVEAVDEVGNAASQTFSWTSDTTAPLVTITSAPNGTTTSASADIAFSVDDPLASLACGVDGTFADLIACTSPFRTGPMVPGTHTVTIRATDEVANVGEATVTFLVLPGPFLCGGYGQKGAGHTFANVGFFDANRITLDGTRVFVAAGSSLFTLDHGLNVTADPVALPAFGNLGINYDAGTDSLYAYTAASGNSQLARVSPVGTVLIGPATFTGINTGSGFVDSAGHMHVINRTSPGFREYAADLNLVTTWGTDTNAASDLELDRQRQTAWALSQSGLLDGYDFASPTRRRIASFTIPGALFSAMTIDDNGTLYGARRDPTNQIVAFTQGGVVLQTLQLPAGSDPASMTFDPVTRRLLVGLGNFGNGIVVQLCPRDP